ncbi:MAG: enoyl-CoA hydratase/isomerase family protein [Planctomycetes bacterium]|nr:enoyl-CoA hydratase/isomerase family protein [Planctomycetota bacterium]MBI3846101.1 enoyl-CoA hydratase/isomerase family protein [Planctomycetota bacterium]
MSASRSRLDVRVTRRDRVATITIDRPDVRNALRAKTLCELTAAFRDAAADESVAVVVLTGEGSESFSSGADLREYRDAYLARPAEYARYIRLFRETMDALLDAGKPTIARINGAAVGGGNELQLGCDLAVMGDHAMLQQVGTRVGSVACLGATQWLPILAGDRRAREILLLCEPVPPADALAMGLVNRVARCRRGRRVDLAPLDRAVDELADKLVNKFPECTRATREQIGFWKRLAWSSTVGGGVEWLAAHFASREAREGIAAFFEKRQPKFRE